jgi:hypothetical protein
MLCACGCGRDAGIYKSYFYKEGESHSQKGLPRIFCRGHNHTVMARKKPEGHRNAMLCLYSHQRRARQYHSGGTFSLQQWYTLKILFGNKCLECLRTEEELNVLGLKLVPDHVLPLAKGGTNDAFNIQPLCHGKGGCNYRKGVKHIDFRHPSAIYFIERMYATRPTSE